MDSHARLERALGASAAPRRDPAFTVAVMQQVEERRFRVGAVVSILRAGGLAALGGIGALLAANWAGAHWDGVQTGLVLAAAAFALVGFTRSQLRSALAR